VGNSSYVARVAFWDYIFRGVLEEELAVLINESGDRREAGRVPAGAMDGWELDRAQSCHPPSASSLSDLSGPSEETMSGSPGLIV
jgi:hypothetical protein